MIAVVRMSQRAKQFINIVLALKSAELLHADAVGVHRIGKRHPVMRLTYRPTA